MIRKTMLAIAATVALGAAALAPTAASAKYLGGGHGFHGGFHGGFGWRGVGITVVDPGVSCLQYRWVETYRGLRRRLVDVCAY